MQPLQNQTVTPTLVADQVYEVIERAILTGELGAGAPLRVRDVAAMVGTSVMPVREAIRHLEEAGLVERIPHRGAVVKTFTATELIDIYDVRKTLETDAAAKGTENVTKAGLRKMESTYKKLQKAVTDGDVVLALDLDEDLLRVVYGASRNPVLLRIIEQLWLQCRPYKVIGASEALAHEDMSLWEPQGALIEAVRAGNTEAAVAITAESLANARKRLEKRLEETTEAE
ncbi:MAG: GntR family transcriptional regulator [Leucobacter sp.]